MPTKSSEKQVPGLTHLDKQGNMRMVDVGGKVSTRRVAVAEAKVLLGEDTRRSLESGIEKGDVLAAARYSGITAAKKTSDLIPLCHPLSLSFVSIDIVSKSWGLLVVATAETTGATGVEMEAMTAASVASLTIYDMLKAIERGISIEAVQLVHKSGGKSGVWSREKNL